MTAEEPRAANPCAPPGDPWTVVPSRETDPDGDAANDGHYRILAFDRAQITVYGNCEVTAYDDCRVKVWANPARPPAGPGAHPCSLDSEV